MLRSRLLLGAILMLAAVSSSFGASARWNALGNEHRFMFDTSNYGIYPGRMYMFSDAIWIIPNIPGGAGIPDNMMSGVLVTSGNTAWALHYNLPGTVAFPALRTGLGAAGGNLAGLVGHLRPIPDLFMARKMGDAVWAGRLVLGLASNEPAADKKASAMSTDLAVGVTMPIGMGDLDLGLRLGLAGFSDESTATKRESTAGIGIGVDARLLMDQGDGVKLIPVAAVSYLAPPMVDGGSEMSTVGLNLGLGYNKTFPDRRMLVLGAVMDYSMETTSPPGASDVSVNSLQFMYLSGYEVPMNSWLIARGGANAQLRMTGGDNPTRNGTSSAFYYNFGVRTVYRKFLADFIFDRALFHRGPYLLSGQGANWATNICLTYLFGPVK